MQGGMPRDSVSLLTGIRPATTPALGWQPNPIMKIIQLSEQPGSLSGRARPPGINAPANEQRRLKTGWNWRFASRCADYAGFSPVHRALLSSTSRSRSCGFARRAGPPITRING